MLLTPDPSLHPLELFKVAVALRSFSKQGFLFWVHRYFMLQSCPLMGLSGLLLGTWARSSIAGLLILPGLYLINSARLLSLGCAISIPKDGGSVICIWCPHWVLPTSCVFLIIRYKGTLTFLCINLFNFFYPFCFLCPSLYFISILFNFFFLGAGD